MADLQTQIIQLRAESLVKDMANIKLQYQITELQQTILKDQYLHTQASLTPTPAKPVDTKKPDPVAPTPPHPVLKQRNP